jgi:hypothetical protein
MGKRELLLIGGFALAGVMVYHATAPAAAPDHQSFSIGKLLDHVRREMRGNRASAEVKSSTVVALKPGVTEVRFESGSAPLTIVGEERGDVSCDLGVWSNGVDETEAQRYASETRLKLTDAGHSLIISIIYPEPAQQRATLAVRLPQNLAVRIQPSRAKVDITDVSSVEIVEARGQVTVRNVRGRLLASHRGGTLTLENVSDAKINTRGSEVVLKHLTGETMLQMQGGELRGDALTGPLEIESHDAEIELEDLTETRKPLRVNAVGGSVRLAGVSADVRVDGRDTDVDVTMARPAPVAISNDGDEPLQLTLPIGGVDLDAIAMHGRITIPEGLVETKTTGPEQRATGSIAGGGPTVSIRSSRGEITVRLKKPEE